MVCVCACLGCASASISSRRSLAASCMQKNCILVLVLKWAFQIYSEIFISSKHTSQHAPASYKGCAGFVRVSNPSGWIHSPAHFTTDLPRTPSLKYYMKQNLIISIKRKGRFFSISSSDQFLSTDLDPVTLSTRTLSDRIKGTYSTRICFQAAQEVTFYKMPEAVPNNGFLRIIL